MDLLQRMLRWVGRPRRQQLVDHLAAVSLERVWRRVAHRVASMRPAVARGYIRARAIGVINRNCETLAWQYPQLNAVGHEVQADALERIVTELERRAARLARQPRHETAARRAA